MLTQIKPYYRFLSEMKQFISFCKKNKVTQIKPITTIAEFTIIVSPWSGTAVPWYSITLALLLQSKNKSIDIVIDDLPFGKVKTFFHFQIILVKLALKLLPNLKCLSLSKFRNHPTQKCNSNTINDLVALNSIHFTKGETNATNRKKYEALIKQQYALNFPIYTSFFDNENAKKIIFPGGIWGNSGLITYLCNLHNIQPITFDSGEGIMLLSLNGVAAQLKDIPLVFKCIQNSVDDKSFAIVQGEKQLNSRRQGTDQHSFFDSNSSNIDNQDYFLILLNSVWDSAALGLHTIYDSMIDWIFDSIDWVIANTNDTKIVIRQHPAERRDALNNSDNYAMKIQDKYKNHAQVLFIEAAQDISSYELIEASKCVLGFSSTSIVEAVALKKPSIIVSSVYYSTMDIVFSAHSKNEYYHFLTEAQDNNLIVSTKMQENAYISNYITQSCNWVNTNFTPTNNDFAKWVKEDLETLSDNLIIEAITSNTPTSKLNHLHKIKSSRNNDISKD